MTAVNKANNRNILHLLSQRSSRGGNQHHGYRISLPSSLCNVVCRSKDEHSVLGSQQQPGGVPPFACDFGKTSGTQQMLATADEDGHVYLYNTQGSSKLAKEWAAHNNAIFDLKWADNEPWVLTASGDQTAALWDVNRGGRLAVFKQHTSSLKTIAFRHGDRNVFATGARDGRIMVWDIRCNHQEGPPSYHTPVNAIADGHIPVAPSTPKPAKRQRQTPTRSAAKSSVTAVVFQDEFSLISSGSTDSIIKVWDIRAIYKRSNKKPLPKTEYPYCGTSARNVGFSSLILNSSQSCVYASCTDNVIYAFNCLGVNQYPVACYMGHSNSSFYVKSALSSDDNFLLSGSSDSNAYIWKVDNPSQDPIQLIGHTAEVTSVAWSPLEFPKLVTCADDNSIRVWNLSNQSEEQRKKDEDIIGRALQEKNTYQRKGSNSGMSSPLASPRPPSRGTSTSPFTTLQSNRKDLKRETPIKKDVSLKTFFAKKRLATSEPNNNSPMKTPKLSTDNIDQNNVKTTRTKDDVNEDTLQKASLTSLDGPNVCNDDKENELLCQRLPESPPKMPLSPTKSFNVNKRSDDKDVFSGSNSKPTISIPDSCQENTPEIADNPRRIKKLSWPNSVEFNTPRKPSNPCQGCRDNRSPPFKLKHTGKITGYFKRLSKDKTSAEGGETPS